jgi:heme oxygenase
MTVNGIFEAIGCLYVIEGSTLGGQIILHSVQKSLNLDAGGGVKFFHGYGARTPGMWKSFISALDSIPPTGEAADAVEQGAMQTFLAFTAAWGDEKER